MTTKDQWRRCRVLDRSGRWALLYLALVLVVVAVTRDLSSGLVRALILGGMLLWTIPIAMYFTFRCPRCGKRFFVKDGALWQLERSCPHCGL